MADTTAEPGSWTAHGPRLSAAMVGFVVVGGLLGMLALWWPINRHARSFESHVQADIALRGAQGLHVALSRAIEREWESLEAVAGNADPTDMAQMRNFADAVIRAGGRVAWAGFADRGGIIRAGANGDREGQDVGSRRWFREGLKGGSIGGVFVPAEKRTGSASADERLVNLSAPVYGDNGEVMGVFSYSLRIAWVSDYVTSAAEELQLDAFITDRENELLVSRDTLGAPLSASTLSALSLNNSTAQIVTDPDGRDYIFAVVPDLSSDAMPPLRWRLLVRVPAISSGGQVQDLSYAIIQSLLVLFGVLLIFGAIFTRHFVRPIERLSQIAHQIAEGKDVYPEEFHSTRESAELSQSLSRIQNRLG